MASDLTTTNEAVTAAVARVGALETLTTTQGSSSTTLTTEVASICTAVSK